ncbi:MAG: phage baseplate assembly protein [Geobacteraceae bacterium]|nr:phage baseplate assembly protein [Geobacteraceae bacterium]
MIRGIVKSVVEGVIKRFSASGRPDETIENREYFQHYGYTSRPKAGAEIIIIREGGHFVAVASDDRRYRIALENGEVALYDDLGQKMHLKRGGIDVTSPTKITATAPLVEVVATTKVTLTTPLLEVSGDITSGGDITAAGDVADANGTKTMAGMRQVYGSHSHPHPADGVTIPAPNEAM